MTLRLRHLVIAAALTASCRASAPARTAGDVPPSVDGGLPVPPPSTKTQVFVPADTGLGAGPAGTTSTGTNGNAVSPAIGATPQN